VDVDPRIAARAKEPRYSIPEGAAFIDRPTSTVRRWALGNVRQRKGAAHRDKPLLRIDGDHAIPLSFLNLLELRFLAAYRQRVPLQSIRRALDYAGSELGAERPLLSVEFKVHGKSLFMQFAAEGADSYLDASKEGQLAWPAAVEDFIESIDYEESTAFRWWPLGRQQPVIVDTLYNGGLPSTAESGVRTNAIAVHRGEGLDVTEIADDVGATVKEVRAALRFERVAA
jgi:uncharacterized protein (DUF433 family)